MHKIICIAYIAFITGMAVSAVGRMPESPPEPYSWWLPLAILSIMIAPATTGYLAGRDDEKTK